MKNYRIDSNAPKKYVTKSDEETQLLGEEFSSNLKMGDVILLYGNLGYGKTTFIKGLMKGLGVSKRVMSPTFVIIRTYVPKNKKGVKRIYHADLYRIENDEKLVGLGIDEKISDPAAIVVVEWPEKIKKLPEKRWEVKIEMNNDNTRIFNILEYV
ncbi:MAG TPA: tRNA (adenosine(37)-N6)-threonylcarbamoyltransferase complex ATPase subunit type 1 TsaE [Candidatus Levybacteria bacterium]|nr:tRNA (adenosine(37)-N6)-threonylcarbamoyltransferase complex ATPase subunit type 1 TsaE [Candidatus Levybacteria bacterium]